MAFSCRIVRDNFDRVIGVEAPNGKSSVLFKNILNYLHGENSSFSEQEIQDAITTLGSIELKEFQDFYTDEEGNLNYRTDINGEPVVEDVLTFLKFTEKHRLNELGKVDLEEFVNQSELDYDVFQEKLKSAFLDSNGNFVIDEQKLKDSELYNQLEIDNILEDEGLQNIIRNNIFALNKEDFIQTYSNNFLNISNGKFNSFGKQQTYDSNNLLRTILNRTTEALDENEFDNLLKESVSDEIYQSVSDNTSVYEALKELSLNLKKVEVKSVENGIVKNDLQRDLASELKETLVLSKIKQDTLYDLQVLNDLDYDVLLNNVDDIMELIKSIEEDLITSNIDVIGLSNKLINEDIEKVQSFIKALNSFVRSVKNGQVSDYVIETFADIHSDFFGNDTRTEFVNIDSFDQNVVKINGNLSKIDAYKNGYLRVSGDYYIQVPNQSFEEVMNELLNEYEVGNNLLENYIPSKLKTENQYRNYFNSLVMSEINDFGEEVSDDNLDIYKTIKIFERLYEVDRVKENEKIDYRQDKQDLQKKDLDYLSNTFFADLNNIILSTKFTGNSLYDKIFQYLEFKNGGINIKENKEVVISRIQNIISDNNKVLKELKDYFKPVEQFEETLDQSIERETYFLNPNMVYSINSDFSIVNGQILTSSVNNDFISNNGKVYEKIDSVGGINIYSPLVEKDGKVIVENSNKNIETTLTENRIEINNNYSQKQGEDLFEDLTKCNG